MNSKIASATRSRRAAIVLTALLASSVALTACSSSDAGPSTSADCDTAPFDKAISAYTEGPVVGLGPYGETSADASTIKLTDDEVDQIRSMGAKAAVVMHFSGDSWSNAQVDAIKAEFDKLGIKIVAQTDAQADPAKQFSDIETALAADPDVIVSIPSLDTTALAPAYRKAVEQGVKLVFMENPAKDFVAGKDYVSVVAMDNYGAGVLGAHQMARALCGKGEVAAVFHAAEAPTNVLRIQGFEDTIKADYPDIKIVESQGLLGPDWKGETSKNVDAWLTKHPDLAGVWCFFDAPCEGAIDSARSAGRDDFVVTTVDLGSNVALDMAQNGFTHGIAAAQPYDQGTTEAILAGYALLGKEAPAFVELPAVPVSRDTLEQSWQDIYHVELPEQILTTLNEN